MTGKTIDKQTLAFLSAVANNLPMMTNMQEWIEKPIQLKQLLRRCFTADQHPAFRPMGEPIEKTSFEYVALDSVVDENLAEWELPESCVDVEGSDPLALYDASPALGIGFEYSELLDGKKVYIRPRLVLWNNLDMGYVDLPCEDVFHGHHRVASVSTKTILAFLSEDLGIVSAISRIEDEYMVSVASYWKTLTPQLRIRAISDTEWSFALSLFTAEGEKKHLFLFKLSKAIADKKFFLDAADAESKELIAE